jgi:glycosyltransferase involved in cell wall biosynthesis
MHASPPDKTLQEDSASGSQRRICLVIGGFAPFVGGGERHAHLLAAAWVRQGHEVTVLTRRMQADWAQEEEMDGFRICRVGPAGANSWGKYGMIPTAMCWLWRHRREWDLVMICAFRVLGWVGVWSHLLGLRTWMRAEACGEWSGSFIWQGAGRARPRRIRKLLCWPYIACRNLCFRCVDAFVSIGPDIRAELESGPGRPRRILDIPNGLDLAAFAPPALSRRTAQRRALGWGEEAFVWAYSGKLIRGKGLEDLLQAWEQVLEVVPAARLLLIGSGEGQPLNCEPQLRRTVESRHWEESVMLTGYVADVAALLSAADGYVFPSHRESFGLGPLEAMAMGLPVVATRSGGVEAFLEEGVTGRLVPVGDVEALGAVMLESMRHPEQMQTLAAAGRDRVVERYAIDQIASRHIEALDPAATD